MAREPVLALMDPAEPGLYSLVVQCQDGWLHVYDLPRRTESEDVPLPDWPSYGRNGGNTRGPAAPGSLGAPLDDRVAGLGISATIRGVAPTPASTGQEITVASGVAQQVILDIYDVAGRRVRRLLHGGVGAGLTTVRWDGLRDDGDRAASGIYWYRLSWRTGAESRRVVVLH